MGRITKYTKKFIKMTYDYIESCVDTEQGIKIKENKKVVGEAINTSTLYGRKLKVNIPTIEKLALVLNVCRFSIYNWEKEHPDFAEALDALRAEQCNKLIQNGLSGDYNPVITRLILSTNHGMKERSDVTTDDKEIKGNTIIFKDFSDDTDSEQGL